jgi:hypothetical protein
MTMDRPGPAKVTQAFVRRLINNGLQIESRCKSCGVVIVGSAMEGLAEKEQQHIQNCPKIVRD